MKKVKPFQTAAFKIVPIGAFICNLQKESSLKIREITHPVVSGFTRRAFKFGSSVQHP